WHASGWAWYNRRSQGSRPRPDQVHEPRTPFDPTAQSLRKVWRSLGSPTPDTALWGCSPDLPVWRDGDQTNERGRLANTSTVLSDSYMAPLAGGGVHRP